MKIPRFHPIMPLAVLLVFFLIFFFAKSDRGEALHKKSIALAKEAFTQAEKRLQQAEAELGEAERTVDLAYRKYQDIEHEKQCAQCRAYHARGILCDDYQIERYCNASDETADLLISTYFGEILDICYGDDGEYLPCITQGYGTLLPSFPIFSMEGTHSKDLGEPLADGPLECQVAFAYDLAQYGLR